MTGKLQNNVQLLVEKMVIKNGRERVPIIVQLQPCPEITLFFVGRQKSKRETVLPKLNVQVCNCSKLENSLILFIYYADTEHPVTYYIYDFQYRYLNISKHDPAMTKYALDASSPDCNSAAAHRQSALCRSTRSGAIRCSGRPPVVGLVSRPSRVRDRRSQRCAVRGVLPARHCGLVGRPARNPSRETIAQPRFV